MIKTEAARCALSLSAGYVPVAATSERGGPPVVFLSVSLTKRRKTGPPPSSALCSASSALVSVKSHKGRTHAHVSTVSTLLSPKLSTKSGCASFRGYEITKNSVQPVARKPRQKLRVSLSLGCDLYTGEYGTCAHRSRAVHPNFQGVKIAMSLEGRALGGGVVWTRSCSQMSCSSFVYQPPVYQRTSMYQPPMNQSPPPFASTSAPM